MRIEEAKEADIPDIRKLFREYADWLGIDLGFQKFDEELSGLPGCYAPPSGFVLLARKENTSVGCVGIRQRTAEEAELKRLYVQKSYLGQGVGRLLFNAAMEKAQKIGYKSVVLDTLPFMESARSLYKAYGFKEIAAYYDNPEKGSQYYRYEFS